MNNKKKLNLLYESTLLTDIFNKNYLRTGLFFAIYNVLKELKESKNYNIILHLNNNQTKYLPQIKKDPFLKTFKYVISYNSNMGIQYLKNIEINKSKIKVNKNIIKLCVYILKIMKNTILYNSSNILNRKTNKIIENTDIYFSSYGIIPNEVKNNPVIKIFIILHDALPVLYPDYYPTFFYTKNYIKEYAKMRNLNKENYYFCNSECTKNDFLKFYHLLLDQKKLYVIYHSSSQTFIPNYDKNKLNNVLKKYNINIKENDKYIFSLCTLEPRKNLIFTIKCFIDFIKKHNINNLYFYLAGGQWDFFINQLEKSINNLGNYRDKIIKLGYIDDEDVNILYSNSLFFTFISQYEGFGVPPLEAMQAGTPVITSNNSSLPEVVGDAAITIDYDNKEQCLKAFEDLYFNENLRNNYIKKGLERSKYFSWKSTVDKMNKIINNIINSENEIKEPYYISYKNNDYIKKIIFNMNESIKNIKTKLLSTSHIIFLDNNSKLFIENIKEIHLIKENNKNNKILIIPKKYRIIKNPFLIELNYNKYLILNNQNNSYSFNSESPAIFPVSLKTDTLYKVECEIEKENYLNYIVDFYAGPSYDLPYCEYSLQSTPILSSSNRYAYIESSDISLAGNNQIYLRIFFHGNYPDSSVRNVKLFELVSK